MDPAAYLSGQLLIALPAIGDPRFERAVALLFAHDAAHAMGLVLNKPVDGLKLGTVLEQLSIACPEARRSEASLKRFFLHLFGLKERSLQQDLLCSRFG